MTRALRALCVAYADHVGLAEPGEGFKSAVEAQIASWPAWARWGAELSAAAVLWAAPMLLAGRARAFGSLSCEDKERVLTRLQQLRQPALRGAFLLVKPIVLGACYRRPMPS